MFAEALFSLLIVGVLYYFQYYYRRWRKKYAQFMKLPGPRNYPLIGNVWKLMFVPRLERIKYMDSLTQKYGTLFRMWNGMYPFAICTNAEDVEIVLSSRVNIEKSFGYDFLKPWLGTGLLTSGGSKWHQRRKLLTPAFHFSILESFLPSISEHSRTFVERLKCMESEKNEWNIFPFVHKFTLDAICETALGVKMNIQNSESPEYLQSVLDMGTIIKDRIMKPWWHNAFLYSYSSLYKQELKALEILHTMSKKVIQEKKNERRKESLNNENTADASNANHFQQREGTKKKAFLELLLNISEDEQVPLTDEDIREEVDTFMFEGHDTTTSGISSTIHFLSSHSDIQDKVAVELYSVFGNSDRDPTLKDLSKLKYLECVIKESHRLLPPVPIIFRKLSEPIILSGEYVIPEDTLVQVDIYGLHRQEKYFPNPLEFNPDNFTLENARSRHPFSFVPFSAGPRNCIGQKFALLEEKVLLSALLRNFKIKSSQKIEELGIHIELVLRHAKGILLNIERREW